MVTGGLGGLIYGLIEGPTQGWSSPGVLVPLVVGIVLLACVVPLERRVADPLLPPKLFASMQFSAANAVTFVVYGALGGALFLLPVVLQEVAGFSAAARRDGAAAGHRDHAAVLGAVGALAARIGPRLQMSVGPFVIAAGLLLLVRTGQGSSYAAVVLPAVLVFGFGLAITVAPLTATALGAAPAEHAGVASAVNNDVARAAGLIAVAVLPAIAGITGDSYMDPVALTHGFRIAIVVSAGMCVLGGVLAAFTIRNPARDVPSRHRLDHEMHCALEAPPLRGRGTAPVPPGREAPVP